METITSVFKPASSLIGKVVELGPIDQIAPRCYMTTFFCLRLAPNITTASIIKRVQRMVFYAVQDIPQLLTTVVSRNNSREELELRYLEDSGACLTFKDYTSEHLKHEWTYGSFDDLAKDHFPYHKLERRTLIDGINPDEIDKHTMALKVQANLIPGGLLLVSALHHTVCDGLGSYLCNATLAKHCRNNLELDSSTLPIEFGDRQTIITPDIHASLQDLPDWRLVTPGEEFLNPTHYDPASLSGLQCAIYYISEERIKELKDVIAASCQRPSASEAICALLWRHVVRARNIDSSEYPEAKLSLTVNARARMSNPMVPRYFWGNMCEPNAVARMPTAAFSSKEFFTSATKQSMQFTALDWGTDFGGCCEAFRVQIGDIEGKPDGRCIMFPPRKGDGQGLEVMLQYERSTLHRLDADRAFTRWFERRS
ncbi:hypothetical protein IFR04_000412 [Cadophora malorum]|uniref:Trichothecene 3-O-acetyltransferase n=1 Tax=Cadophora malorum TaxID=108018 RepID=A0A8H8BWC3_9HELO|nr:hypothetical protein IFR04_000412 [Cadophora malorum]